MRRLPWTLYIYLARELYVVFVVSLIALLFLFMIVSGLKAVGNGFSLAIILPWVFESLGYFLFFSVPVALLIATTLVYGRFVAEKEYTAVSATGISPFHLFVPMGALALLLTTLAVATQGWVLPEAHYVQRNIARYLIKQLDSLGRGQDRQLPIEGGTVFCAFHDGPFLEGVRIEKQVFLEGDQIPSDSSQEKDGFLVTLRAEQAYVSVDEQRKILVLMLKNVYADVPNLDEPSHFEVGRIDWPRGWNRVGSTDMTVEFPIDEKERRRPDKTTTVLQGELERYRSEVDAYEEQLSAAGSAEERAQIEGWIAARELEQRKIQVEIWSRRAIALSVFVFALLGFPISLTLRHTHRLVGFFIGVSLVVVFFYPSLMLGENLAELGVVPAWLALLSGDLILLAIGTFLCARLAYR